MKTILLGTGTPNAEPDRSGPSVAITASGSSFVVDCGPGVVRMASRAYEMGVSQLKPDKLSNLFLTHLHSDHTAGFPDFILTPWVLGREKPLRVWGPPGTGRMIRCILDAYASDIKERLEGLEPANTTGWQVIFQEVSPGIVLENEDMKVECFPVNHGGLPSFGYRFTESGETVVISGDTAPFAEMKKCYSNCRTLVHEVYSSKGLQKRSDHWKRYHRSVHTSADELAEMASTVNPELLVLYHQLLHGVEEEELMEEIKSRYKGEVVYGRDLDTF